MSAAMDASERTRLIDLVGAHTVPYWQTVGITVEDVHEPGHVTLGLPIHPRVGNRRGVIHGGAIMSLIDATGGGAVRSTTPPPLQEAPGIATVDINVTFINAARGSITATGRVVRRGRSLAFVEVNVHDEGGVLVALSRMTYSVPPTP